MIGFFEIEAFKYGKYFIFACNINFTGSEKK